MIWVDAGGGFIDDGRIDGGGFIDARGGRLL